MLQIKKTLKIVIPSGVFRSEAKEDGVEESSVSPQKIPRLRNHSLKRMIAPLGMTF